MTRDAEKDLDVFIERRAREAKRSDQDETLEEMWRESERRERECRRRRNAALWYEFHMRLSDAHTRIAEQYEEKALSAGGATVMSRGIGQMQRRILAVLAQGVGGELVAIERTYLKALLRGDRSNLRRAIRGLLARHLIEERIEGGRHYYELTLTGWIVMVPPDPSTAPNPIYELLCCRLNRNPHE